MTRVLWIHVMTLICAVLVWFTLAAMSSETFGQALYSEPVLVTDPEMHTAVIRSVAVDSSGQVAVTGSEDKTVRLWSIATGKLLQTIRMPAGPDFIGQVFAVAISPDGNQIAIGGWTADEESEETIFSFDRNTKRLSPLVTDLPDAVNKLVFSADGRFLAAAIRSGELRVYDREKNWIEVLRDTDYGSIEVPAPINGISFAPDGRLATASFDRKIRLYSAGLKPIQPPMVVSTSAQPFQIAFSPDGNVIAVGYADATAVDLLDGHNLNVLRRPDVEGIAGHLAHVGWSSNGQTLIAGGKRDVFIWDRAGRGARQRVRIGSDLIEDLVSASDGSILVATADPLLRCIEGIKTRWEHKIAFARNGTMAVSKDGTLVEFGWGASRLRFDVHNLTLSMNPTADYLTFLPKHDGLLIDSWRNEFSPTIGDQLIELEAFERATTLAIAPDNSKFVLGTDWFLRAIDANNVELWKKSVGAVLDVNITRDGRLVVAAYGDGTIRWHKIDDGQELLALTVLPDMNWVAWTPAGFYDATEGAMIVLQWHVNHGTNAGEQIPIYKNAQLRRRDLLPAALDPSPQLGTKATLPPYGSAGNQTAH
jgi:WD40 repeat protein